MLHERVPWKTVAATLTGGLLMGYGARPAGFIRREPGLQHLLEYGQIYRLPPPEPLCYPR